MKRLFSYIFFSAVLFAITADNCISQKSQYIFNRITIEAGLSNNSITCIFKDSRGFIWIGTTDGLNRYDGYSFVIYKNNPLDSNSISDNFISSIIEDFSGNLWIGTQGGGLNMYNIYIDQFIAFYHDPRDNQSITSNFIFHHNSLLLDKDSILWIGTNNGLCSYDFNEGIFIRRSLKSDQEGETEFKDIRVIFEDEENILWIGTNSGLVKYFKNSGDIRIFKNRKDNSKSISNNIITSVSEDILRNELWVGTEDGLNIFNKETEEFVRYFSKKGNANTISDNSITSIIKDETGNFWIGTKSGGLNRFDAAKKLFTHWKYDLTNPEGLSDNYVDYLFFDKSGLLWIGTVNTGINLLDIKEKQFKLIKNDPANPNSLSYNTIRAIYEDNEGIIWIGTYGGGLNKYYKNNFTHYVHHPEDINSLSHNIVTTIHEDISGNLLVGTWGGGLNKLDKKSGRVTRNILEVPEFVNDIYEDESHNLWIGCNGGLYVYDQVKKNLVRFDSEQDTKRKLTATSINKIVKDNSGNLWIGTWDGLNKIILKSNSTELDTIIHFTENPSDINSLSDNRIVTLYEDSKGNLWIGTYAGGLNKLTYDSSGTESKLPAKFAYYTDEEGISGNTIYGILEDDNGYLWISTNQGLSKFHPADETFYNFDVVDGLQGYQFYWRACARSRSGEMYFGGINGLNVFDPAKIKLSEGFPKVIITDLQLFNKSVKVGKREEGRQILFKSIIFTDRIKLTRKDYAFAFEFAALTFKSQNKIKYAYKLENFDDKWIYTDARKRYATYSHLRPGDYIFKVKSTNKDGIWNDNATEIEITVLPAYWETIWAFFVYGIILLLLLYYFRSQILARAKYRHNLQLERIEREKAGEYNDMKLRFFTNISHEFKTPLTLILGPVNKLLSMDKLDNKIKEQLSLMHSGSKRLLRLISQLMEFRKVETGNLELKISKNDIIPVLKEIAFSFKSKSIQKKIKYSLKIPAKSAFIWFDQNVVETIVYNLLSNAFKFTPEHGKIRLSLKFTNEKGDIIIPNQKDERYLLLKVSDTGIGISKERMDTLFKRFYQIEKSEEQKRGTGIGLALCKDLVEIHHGEISVESQQGVGTDFTVKLPVHESLFNKKEFVEDEESTRGKKVIPGFIEEETEVILIDEDISSVEFREPKIPDAPLILIIEDDIELVKYIGNLLEDNYRILTSNSCEKGMELLIKEEPELLILDIMMPGMSGLELCQKIKTDIRISHIPVILLTALTSIEDRIKGLSTGADSYISKPFHPDHLIVSVEKLIEQRKQLKLHFQKELYHKPDSSGLPSIDEKFLNKVMNYIEEKISEPDLNVESLSREAGISTTHLYRKIKSLTDLSPNELIRKVRLRKAAEFLSSKQVTISEVMYEVGFSNHSYFAKCFHEEFGCSPRDFLLKQNAR
jgi:signal transduction histidine kinase/ligand-binding sensor domain-containing protein/DNA-binding response OmpR family regulator